MTKKKKRRLGLFDHFFSFDIEDELERMQEEMSEMISRMQKTEDGERFEKFIKPDKTKVYGFSMRMGPDGKPVFREFGNINPTIKNTTKKPELVKEEREPLIDVFEKKGEVIIIAEVPGASKKDIKVKGTGKNLTIDVNGSKKYYKKLMLPSNVDHSSMKMTYKNGILEVKFKAKK